MRCAAVRGFTLLELLITIAIIAMLLAVLLPALGRARRLGQDAYCRSHLNQIAKSFHLYAEGNRGSPPDENSPVSWDQQLRPYVAKVEIFRCPGDRSRAGRRTGLSYGWRETMVVTSVPASLASLADKNLPAVVPNDVAMVFDWEYNWHRDDELNAAQVSTAAQSYGIVEFDEDMSRAIR